MATIDQGTQNPTNKLTAAIVAAAIVAVGQSLADVFWPGIFDQKVWTALFPIAVWGAGYFVKDEATVVMVQNVVETEVAIKPAKEAP